MKKTHVPVLVVGAGAAGTMLTLELARRGINVRTVDRLPKPADTSRAITLHARTLEIFERIDRRLVERFLDRGIRSKGYVLHFVDAAGRRGEVQPEIDFTTVDSRYGFFLLHRQSETERYLREYTSAHYGIAPDWNTACIDVQQDESGVTAVLESDGVREEVHCRYLVGCDGPGSRVRSAVGFESEPAVVELENLDAFLHGFPDADDCVHYCVGPDHFLEIAKLPGGFHRMLRGGAAAASTEAPEQAFLRLVAKHFDGVTLGDVVWHSKWRSAAQLAPAYRNGRVLLAGDAAQAHAPTGGQGVNCAMQDAYNLGWKLAAVIRKQAHASLLDTYEIERRPIAERASSAASSLREIFAGRGADAGERTANARDSASLAAVVGCCSGTTHTYRDSAAPDAGPAVGDRVPDVDLGRGRTLYDLTRHASCTLLALPAREERGPALQAALKGLAHRFSAVLELRVVPPSPALAARYGASEDDRLLLIRPDGHVGFRGRADELGALEARLHEWFAL
jgi:2-polyprenyl-6-methoxyphenol hydroxylase-like FAD-dependent oxidoreductase